MEFEAAAKVVADPGSRKALVNAIGADALGLRSYRALRALADATIDDPDDDGLLALAHAVYGWMPTMLKNWNLDALPKAGERIHSIRSVNTHAAALKLVTNLNEKPINNSWIGTSKLLHFINPNHFPIWDSVVASCFNVGKNTCNNKKRFIKYMKFIHDSVGKNPRMTDELSDLINMKFNYIPTGTRVIELLLYFGAPKNS